MDEPSSPIIRSRSTSLSVKRKMTFRDAGDRSNSVPPANKTLVLDSHANPPWQEILSSLQSNFSTTNQNISDLKNSVDTSIEQLRQTIDLHETQIAQNTQNALRLSTDLEQVKSSISSSIEAGIATYMQNNSVTSNSYNFELQREIDRCDLNFIIYNAKSTLTVENVQKYLRDSNFTADVKSINSRTTQSKGQGPTPLYIVTVSNSFQRNEILRDSSRLSNWSIDRDIPFVYRKTYQSFKKLAYEYRCALNVSTQIIFIGTSLTLRYKDKGDNKSFTIANEFCPPPGTPLRPMKGNSGPPPGTTPSSAANATSISRAKKTVFIFDTGSFTANDIQQRISAFLGGFTERGLLSVQPCKKGFSIECTSPDIALDTSKRLHNHSHDGLTFKTRTFQFEN